MRRVIFIHGACVQDGGWWWQPTARLLAERGVKSHAPLLPSCGETGVVVGLKGPGLSEDVAQVRATLIAAEEPTIVVAHSYGGIVAAEALSGITYVSHLLLVSSYLPEVGESLSSFGDGEPAAFLDVNPEAGTFTVRPGLLAQTFLQDCDPQLQQQAMKKTALQSMRVLGDPVQAAGRRQVPTTYLICAQDRGTPARLQHNYAKRADRVVELNSSHHPFLSQPAAVRDLILGM